MALGVSGTTLLAELNRLANGGTYRVPSEMVDEALAARQWADQRSVSTNLTDTVGILNAIAGTTDGNRLDYNGVCNLIAGTFQLPAAQALRSVAGILPAVVTGGTVATAGGFTYHTFLSSDTLTITGGTLTCDILLVAGGGGGNYTVGGGGGAGGLINLSSQTVAPNSYAVTIGAGGGDSISNGSNSTFYSWTAIGGGFGNVGIAGVGSGGSGGGGNQNDTGGAGTVGQGNAGGNGGNYFGPSGGGGGGAGAPGANSGGYPAGNGGNGLQFSDWATATGTGADDGYYAGGAGGGSQNGSNGTAGLGGGGQISRRGAPATSRGAVANTGGGGAQAGASGIFIIRYVS